ncbi:Zinc finger FYVE domain-containing protein 26 like, partial [Pseudolycoriella hygida]
MEEKDQTFNWIVGEIENFKTPQERAAPVKARTKKNNEPNEIDRYVQEIVTIKGNYNYFNLIEWWKGKAGKFPSLSNLFFKFCAIPASSAAAETKFSLAGYVLCDRRTGTVLNNIMSMLKTATLEPSRLNSLINANDSEKQLYRRMQDNINDAHWRIALFWDTATVIVSRSTSFINDDLRKFIAKHQSPAKENTNRSTDEEGTSKQESTIYRRKTRKKNMIRKPIDDKNLVISKSSEHEQKSDTLCRSISGMERRCPVSRVLGSPEHLATICLINGNFEAAKEIVETKNLENSIPSRELQFIKNCDHAKEKLRSIFAKTYEDTSELNTSTVERLKLVATVGLDASLTESIITQFAQENEFIASDETRNLIKKLRCQYQFLEMFNGSALQASIAVDWIISLTNNYETCFNVFNMLTKLWTNPNWYKNDNVSFGYLKFTKNICECLRLYKSIVNKNFGARDLIFNECSVLLPVELKAKLEKEKVMNGFQCVTTNDVDGLDKYKTFLKLFEIMRGDVNYFSRSYNFLFNMFKLLPLIKSNVTPLDAMETDLADVIGTVIFVNEVIPGNITDVVDNLNINF